MPPLSQSVINLSFSPFHISPKTEGEQKRIASPKTNPCDKVSTCFRFHSNNLSPSSVLAPFSYDLWAKLYKNLIFIQKDETELVTCFCLSPPIGLP